VRRLVFSSTFPAMEHVAIKGLADIALDTTPYNGHVSTGDTLKRPSQSLLLTPKSQ
jgi:predicted O-linked N-acetylglucosamine transferase (SPINDLY family)